MVTDGRWKYACTEAACDELYDLHTDPYEMKNLAFLEEFSDKKREMREMLLRAQAQALDPIPLDRLIPDSV